ALERDRVVLDETEIDEISLIENVDQKFSGLERRLERQREVERQQRILGIVLEIIVPRVAEFAPPGTHPRKGKIVELLERGGVDLGERGKLRAAEFARRLRIYLARGIVGKVLVEGPGVAHARHRSVRREDDLALHQHPDMGVREGGGACDEKSGEREYQGTEQARDHRCHLWAVWTVQIDRHISTDRGAIQAVVGGHAVSCAVPWGAAQGKV